MPPRGTGSGISEHPFVIGLRAVYHMATRTFTIPAGTVIDGFSTPETIRHTITYDKSEMGSGAAQKQAMREAQAIARDKWGVSGTLTSLQRSTKVQHQKTDALTGRKSTVRGGRKPIIGRTPKPKSQNLKGFLLVSKGDGIEIWKRGGNGKALKDAHGQVSAFMNARNSQGYATSAAGGAPATARIALKGIPDERAQYGAKLAKRYGSTATFLASQYNQVFPDGDALTFGVSYHADGDTTNGPGIDIDNVSEISVIIATGATE